MKNNISKCARCCVEKCMYWVKDKPPKFDTNFCSSFQEFDVFKQPLLLHLISDDRKAQAVHDVLKSVHLKFYERESYPYFRLRIR